MNYKLLGKVLGKIMILESILMLAPLAVSFIYAEDTKNKIAFIVPITALALLGIILQFLKPQRKSFYQKEGFALVAIVWIVMTVFGAIPFVINREIPNYIDACFEIMSGFTTTGASIVSDITTLSHSTLFWRSFSHWIGGMGILVFVLIFIPESNDGSSMHLLRAESPGPQVGKLASKMKVTARILYLIYLFLTLIEVGILMCIPLIDQGALVEAGYVAPEGDKLFYALLTSFGSAGTGGFGFIPGSFEFFTPVSQYVVSIFLLIFGCNFALYYLILLGKIKDVFRSEEFRTYLIMVASAIAIIFTSLATRLSTLGYSIEEAFRHSLFQVASIITTTGYSTTDFNFWPMASQAVIIILMFTGAMAGSTAGGIKLSRVVIVFKGVYVNIRKLINPRYMPKTTFEGKSLEEKTTNDVFSFITLYFFVLLATVLILSFDPINSQSVTISSDFGSYTVGHGFASNFTAAMSCISNIGPGLEAVGPYGSFAGYNGLSTLALTFTMLIGRLEILPVIILFTGRTWKKV